MREIFDDILAGDDVILCNSINRREVVKVARITNTQIVVHVGNGEVRFRKDGGRRVGANAWSSSYIEHITPEGLARIEIRKLTEKAISLRERLPIPNSKDELLRFIAALEPFVHPASRPAAGE